MDELFADLAARGWLVNNLYQVDAYLWRVNLRRPDGEGDWFTDWAIAPTLEDALLECMAKLNDAEFFHTPEAKAIAAPVTSAPSLLSRLGLAKPVKIERRI